jgi:hypothetical protein
VTGFLLRNVIIVVFTGYSSIYLLYVSVVRPSSSRNYVQKFPSNVTPFQYFFIILFKLSATCFGRRTIFKQKIYIRFRDFRLTQLYFSSFLLFYSNYPLHVSVERPSSGRKYIRFRDFRLKQLYFNNFLLFCSKYPLHV